MIFFPVWKFFTKTVRRQLIWGVVLVHALLMTLFIADVTIRQKNFLLDQQVTHATTLAHSVTTSSGGWILSNDVIGLQEIIDAQARYPELLYAMAIDREGSILAHTEHQRRGQFILDIPAKIEPTILTQSPELVDIISPAIIAGEHVGWIRIGIGQHTAKLQLEKIVQNGLFYAFSAIIIGIILASIIGTRLTRRLHSIQTVANDIEKGKHTSFRAPDLGTDEAAQLAHQFNRMLDTLENREQEIVTYNEALHESETRFQRTLRGSNDGIWEWNMQTNEVYYSPRWKSMLGYKDEELDSVFSTWERLTYPEDLERTKELIQQYVAGKLNKFEIEFRMQHKAGHWVNILSRAELEYDKKGNPLRLSGTHVDITDRVNAEDRLSQLAENINEVFWLGTPNWDEIFYISPAYEKVWGQNSEELYRNPKAWMEIIHPDDLQQVLDDIPKDIKDIGEYINFREYRIKTPEGQILWIKARAYPIYDPDGQIIRIAGIAEDITERKQAEDNEQKSTQRLADAQRMAHIGSWDLDLVTDELEWSDEIYHIFEIDKNIFDATYEAFLNMVHPEDREKVNEAYTQSLTNKLPYNISHRLQMPDGRIKHVLERCETTYNIQGEPIMSTGTVQDVTEHFTMEETLRRTQKMDALGKLTGGIAHDYNNMLGIILGYSELLNRLVSGQPKLEKYINVIHHAAERGAKLTTKLLSFSRTQASCTEVLNINTLLQDKQDILEKSLTARIKLIFNLEDELWLVHLDKGELEDAIINLCINAMHAIKDNGQLSIQTQKVSINKMDARLFQMKPGEYVKLSFIDTGKGMDEATKEKIFEPFFSTKGDRGTGLGLSQVYGFIDRSGGAIKVHSKQNHGTRMELYFPRYQQIENKEASREKTIEPDFRGNENILVVDDELALLNLTQKFLELQGYNVFCADNANQALDILKNNPIDLLLSDVVMPEMDGYQLATLVQEKYPTIKIQLASGFTDDRHNNLTDKSLHTNLIHKPYQSITLLKRVRELLDEKKRLIRSHSLCR